MSPTPPMDEHVKDGFLRLTDELVEEVFFRLAPDEPSRLVRASAVRKRWRRILADAGFRRRYREFHKTPPVLGLFNEDTDFVPTSALLPAHPDWRHRWRPMATVDCRHGRALITPSNRYFGDFGEGEAFDLTVLDPLTGHQRRVPCPDNDALWFSAAVLCAAQQGCQEGHFRVAFVTTDQQKGSRRARCTHPRPEPGTNSPLSITPMSPSIPSTSVCLASLWAMQSTSTSMASSSAT